MLQPVIELLPPTGNRPAKFQIGVLGRVIQGTNYFRVIEAKGSLKAREVHDVFVRQGEEYWVYTFDSRPDAQEFSERLRKLLATRNPKCRSEKLMSLRADIASSALNADIGGNDTKL